MSSLARWGGPAAVLGGGMFVVLGIVIASMPRGCIGSECAFRQVRDTGVAGALLMPALLLVMAGAAGLVVRARDAGRLGRLGMAGLITGGVGTALLLTGGILQAIFFGGDFPLMPVFVVSGLLALVAGFLLLGIGVLRARVLPRWVDALLVVGSLAMIGFNDQNWLALMAIPFGLAWMAVGYALWSGRSG